MESRAPRLDKIEIPLTLVSDDGIQLQCACLNISSSGALLRFIDDNIGLSEGQLFRSKMLRKGKLVEVWVQVERIAIDGVGVRFLS